VQKIQDHERRTKGFRKKGRTFALSSQRGAALWRGRKDASAHYRGVAREMRRVVARHDEATTSREKNCNPFGMRSLSLRKGADQV